MRLGAWSDMFQQSCTIAPRTGQDGFGAPTYGTAVTYRCRLVGKRRQVLAQNGSQVVANWTAYLYTDAAIDPQGQITLSTADVGSTESWAVNPKMLAVGRFSDEQPGWHHSVVYFAAALAVLGAVA